jgi:hypothetical protein
MRRRSTVKKVEEIEKVGERPDPDAAGIFGTIVDAGSGGYVGPVTCHG